MRQEKRAIRIVLLGVIGVVISAASIGVRDRAVTITGSVVDAASGLPVQAAQVFIAALDIGVLTDQAGRYTLVVAGAASALGDFQLTVQRIGYRQETITLRAPAGAAEAALQADFRLREEAFSLDEIIVTGTPGGTQRRALGNTVTDAGSAATPTRDAASASHDRRPNGGGGTGREQYAHHEDGSFRTVADHPRSTFSVDVDRAAYSNVRRFLLREHRLPPQDAVLIEEMVNYFDYEYELPRGRDPVGITTELGQAPWNSEHKLLRVGLASRPVVASRMPSSNLVFLIDVSGSMSSADKLPLVKSSLRLLVEQLRAVDRVAIVVYAGAAGTVLESTPGSQRGRILEAIERLDAGGSTAGGEGLRLAYDIARSRFERDGNNRVILATDGDFNVGESSDEAMVRLVEERRRQGTFLTVLGFGTGNLQFQKMEALAQHGNGNFAYIDGIDEARRVLVAEMGGTLLTVAKDVKIDLEFNPAHVQSYRLIGYENRMLAPQDFNDDARDAGDMGAGHRVTALYEIVTTGSRAGGVDPLRYRNAPASPARSDEMAFVRVRFKRPNESESRLLEQPIGLERERPSNDFRFAAAVAAFGMLLRESSYMGNLRQDGARSVLRLAEDALGSDPNPERLEFVEMVRAYQVLSEGRRW